MRRRAAGFTLIETLVVLAVLGLAAALVVGRGPWRSAGAEMSALSREAAQVLRGARARAIAANRPVLVAAAEAPGVLLLDGAPVLRAPAGVALAVQGPGGAAGLRFEPDGSATPGRLLLGDGRRGAVVTVDWLTGRVRLHAAP